MKKYKLTDLKGLGKRILTPMKKKSLKLKEGIMRKGGINDGPSGPPPSDPPRGQGGLINKQTELDIKNWLK